MGRGRSHRLASWAAVPAVVLGLSLLAPATAGAAADLRVTKISTTGLSAGRGQPEYVVVKPDGSPKSSFFVHVTVENRGGSPAKPSATELVAYFEGYKEQIGLLHFKEIGPHRSKEVTEEVAHQFRPIGFASLEAIANVNRAVKEAPAAQRNNHLRRLHIAFLAEVWKAADFTSVEQSPVGPKREAQNAGSLKFMFREYKLGDEAFIYDVQGGVNGYVKGEFGPGGAPGGAGAGGGCTINGSAVTAHDNWKQPESLLRIPQRLTSYHASIYASGEEAWPATLKCAGVEVPGRTEKFLDLVTYSDSGGLYPATQPSATVLEDKGHNHAEISSWEFVAELPGEPPPPPPPAPE